MKRALLIGNGPSAADYNVGEFIDDFDGIVVRFNAYRIRNFESHVGTRTDWWISIGNPPIEKQEYDHTVFVCQIPDDRPVEVFEKFQAKHFKFSERIPFADVEATREKMNAWWPSTGALMVMYFLRRGYEVWLHGFDFFDRGREHHYYKKGDEPGPNHKPDKERQFFERLIEDGRIRIFIDEYAAGGCLRSYSNW